MRLLFITWDGPGTNYHESLFIPILNLARRSSDAVHLIQFAWGSSERSRSIARAAAAHNISYRMRPVRRSPKGIGIATTLISGSAYIAAYANRHQIDVVIARSIIPAGMTLAALSTLRSDIRLIYDSDGLMADERVDFAGWNPAALPYRTLRKIERRTVLRADAILVRSKKAGRTLAARSGTNTPVQHTVVVYNGADPKRFTPGTPESRAATRRKLGISESAPVLIFVGSLGGKYRLDLALEFLAQVRQRRPDTVLLIVTGMPERARATLAEFAAELGNSVQIHSAHPMDIPELIATADLGISIIEMTYSMRAVSPIKVSEYLMCGVPPLATSVGDLEQLLHEDCGRLLRSLDPRTFEEAAQWFVDGVLKDRDGYRARCREHALGSLSLEAAAHSYRRALDVAMHGKPRGNTAL